MFSTDDTIVAVATPSGRGGVAVVRLSGSCAHEIALWLAGRTRPLAPRHATKTRLHAVEVPDDALLTYFPSPHSYTGQDVVEIATHGSPVVTAAVVEASVRRGARAADPGEFTLRAFLNGKLDLVQAEAVQELVDAVSPAHARVASGHLQGTLSSALRRVVAELGELHLRLEASMDFPDEGYHFIDRSGATDSVRDLHGRLQRLVGGAGEARRLRDGHVAVVLGAPNVGKSSVFNALVGADRAIVTPVAGTTRDLVSEHLLVQGVHVRLVDTAGVRSATDEIEREGIRRAEQAAADADLVLVVLDRSRPVGADDRRVLAASAGRPRVIVANKVDLPAAWEDRDHGVDLAVSAVRATGIEELAARLAGVVASSGHGADVLVTNARQRAHVQEAMMHLSHACSEIDDLGGDVPEEFLAADVQRALHALEEVAGVRTTDEVLAEIFSRFCIGK